MQGYNLPAKIQHERLLQDLNETFAVLTHLDEIIGALTNVV